MNLKHSSLCVGLIASGVLTFSATPSKAEPIVVPVEFNFSTDKNLGSCSLLTLGQKSCQTKGTIAPSDSVDVGSMTSGFQISSSGGFLKRGTGKGLGIGSNGLIDSGFESITFTLPTLGSKNATLKLLTVGSLSTFLPMESFLIQGFRADNGQLAGSKQFSVNNVNNFNFLGGSAIGSIKLTSKKGNFSLMSARAEIMTERKVTPEPTSTVGVFGLLTGWLVYKGINRLAKRGEPKLLK